MVYLLLLLCLLDVQTLIASDNTYTITKPTNNAGIYFEEIRPLKFIDGNWKIIAYLDGNLLRLNKTYYENVLYEIKTKCMTSIAQCRNNNAYIGKLSAKLQQGSTLQQDLNTIFTQTIKRIPRTSKVTYLEAIEANQYTAYSNLNRTHLMRIDLDYMQSKIDGNNDQISDKLELFNLLSNKSAKVDQKVFLQNNTLVLKELLQLVDDNLELINEMCETVIEVLRMVSQNQIHHRIMNNDQLTQLIFHINGVGFSAKFPLPENGTTIKELNDLISIQTGAVGTYFLAEIVIPLTTKEEMKLYKTHYLPTIQILNHKITTAYIKPRSPYLGTNKNHSYYNMSEEEFEICKQTKTNIICHQRHPVYTDKDWSNCEYLLLTQPQEDHFHSCDIRLQLNFKPYWARVGTNKSWVFSLPSADEITLLCENRAKVDIQLSGFGILYLDSACQALSDNYHIFTTLANNDTSRKIIIPNISLNIKKLIQKETYALLLEHLRSYSYENGTLGDKSLWDLEMQIMRQIETDKRVHFLVYVCIGSLIILLVTASFIIGILTLTYWYKQEELNALRNEGSQTGPLQFTFLQNYQNNGFNPTNDIIYQTCLQNRFETDNLYAVPVTRETQL